MLANNLKGNIYNYIYITKNNMKKQIIIFIIITLIFLIGCDKEISRENDICEFNLNIIHINYSRECFPICDSRLCCQYPSEMNIKPYGSKIFSYGIKNNEEEDIFVTLKITDLKNNVTITPGKIYQNGLIFCWNNSVQKIWLNSTKPFGLKIIDTKGEITKHVYQFELVKKDGESEKRYFIKDRLIKIVKPDD